MFRKSTLLTLALSLLSATAMGPLSAPAMAMSSFHGGGLNARMSAAPAPRMALAPINHSAAMPAAGASPLAGRFVNRSIDAGKFTGAGSRINQIGPSSVTPNVAGRDKTFNGQGAPVNGPNQTIPGVGTNTNTSGPRVNIPGGSQQSGVRAVPGFDNMGGGPQLNLPGTDNNQHSPQDGVNALNKMIQQGRASLYQGQGGFNNLNIPTRSAAGDDVSDKTSGGDKGTTRVNKGADGSSTSITFSKDSNGRNTAMSIGPISVTAVIPGVQVGTPVTPPSQSATGTAEGVGQVIAEKPATPPPPKPDDKKKSPNPSDDTTPVTSSSQLDAHSGFARRNLGGGTGNNTETNSGKSSTLTPGSAYARKNNGDGSDGRGDNSHVDKNGGLAAGSAINRIGYGDGGNSDSRGGTGPTTIPRTINGNAPGAGHNELTLKVLTQQH